jgi:hypothetical protein
MAYGFSDPGSGGSRFTLDARGMPVLPRLPDFNQGDSGGNMADTNIRLGDNFGQARGPEQQPGFGPGSVPNYMQQIFQGMQPGPGGGTNEMYAGMGKAPPQTPFGPSQMPVPGVDFPISQGQGQPGGDPFAGLAANAWERGLNPMLYRLMKNDPSAARELGYGEGDVGPLGSPDFVNRPGNDDDWNKRYFWLSQHPELAMMKQPTDDSRLALQGAIKWDRFRKNAMGPVNANQLPMELQGQVDPARRAELLNKYFYQEIPGMADLGSFSDPMAMGKAVSQLYNLANDQSHDYYLYNNAGRAAIMARALQNPGNMPRLPAPGGGGGGGGRSYYSSSAGGGGGGGMGVDPRFATLGRGVAKLGGGVIGDVLGHMPSLPPGQGFNPTAEEVAQMRGLIPSWLGGTPAPGAGGSVGAGGPSYAPPSTGNILNLPPGAGSNPYDTLNQSLNPFGVGVPSPSTGGIVPGVTPQMTHRPGDVWMDEGGNPLVWDGTQFVPMQSAY